MKYVSLCEQHSFYHGMQEVSGSIPLSSTNTQSGLKNAFSWLGAAQGGFARPVTSLQEVPGHHWVT